MLIKVRLCGSAWHGSQRCVRNCIYHVKFNVCLVTKPLGVFSSETEGAFHSTKIAGNFGLKLNGTVRSNRKSFEKISPPLEVDHCFRLDRSDRNGPFHLTILTHSQSQYLTVRYFHVQHERTWRKTLSM